MVERNKVKKADNELMATRLYKYFATLTIMLRISQIAHDNIYDKANHCLRINVKK